MGNRGNSPTGEAADNIVPLDRFRSGRSLSPLRQAEAYWQALCAEGQIPRRSRIDPRALENILPHCFILERVARRRARFRLAGDHLAELAGMDMRGMAFAALFADAARAEAGAILQRMFAAPAVAELRLDGPTAPDETAVEGRMLLLPLATDDGKIARALGVLVADCAGVRPPLRFDIANRLLRPLAVAAPARADPPVPDREPTDGFAEPAQSLAGAPSHLRLVKSDP